MPLYRFVAKSLNRWQQITEVPASATRNVNNNCVRHPLKEMVHGREIDLLHSQEPVLGGDSIDGLVIPRLTLKETRW